MNKSILLILAFFIFQKSKAQQAVVALPAMNVVYVGLDNPVQIAVEGYTNDQITVWAELFSSNNIKIIPEGSFITHVNGKNYILKVTNPGTCFIKVSYKKEGTLKTETFEFRVKSIPKPESMFGVLESGDASVKALLDQYTLNAVMPNFYIDSVEFKIQKYEALFVPKNGKPVQFSSKTNQIPLDLKRCILKSGSGDKILLDDIKAIGPGNLIKRLAPIAITIHNYFPQLFDFPEYFIYQKENDSLLQELKASQIYNKQNEYTFGPGILRGYKAICEGSQLLEETKRTEKKIIWEKHYYPSGKLKTEYNFEENDSIGKALSYYESGQIKSQGNVLVKSVNINEQYRPYVSFGNCVGYGEIMFLDTFLLQNYAPYGQWKCYSENGILVLDCYLKLFNYGIITLKPSDPEFDLSENNPNKKEASIKEAIESKDGYFKPSFTGSFKLFNRQGQLISAKNY